MDEELVKRLNELSYDELIQILQENLTKQDLIELIEDQYPDEAKDYMEI